MKKAFSVLMLLVAMLMAWPTRAQLQLTVADGTTTNSYVPVYGLWTDSYTRSQMIYPGTDLVLMTGGMINGLTFYSSDASVNWGAATFQVKLGEVSSTTLSAFSSGATTTVYTGAVTSNASGQMEVTFTTPYAYQGGNLLVEFFQTVTGTYQSYYFYGISSTGSSASGYSSSGASSASFNQRDFLPKVTFNYAPANTGCAYPLNLAVSGVDSTQATLTWSDTSGASNWRVFWYPTDSISLMDSMDVYDTTYTFYGLNPNTAYTAKVMTVCDTSNSIVMNASFRTLCGINPTPYSQGFEGRNTGDVPYCWSQIATGTSGSGTFPSIYNYSSNTHAGSGYFEFESSTGQTEIAALPSVDFLTNLRLRFWAACTSTNFVLEAGVMEDTAFVVVDTVVLTAAADFGSSAYHEYSVYYNNYMGYGNRMALRVTAASSYTLMIDDLVIEDIPTCPIPTSFNASVSGDTVDFSWSDAINTSWELVYGAVGFNPNTAVNTEYAYMTTHQVTGLSQGFYEAYVRADCGGDSSWAGPISFNVGILVMNMATSGTDTVRSCAAIIYDNGGPNGNYSTSCDATLVILPDTPGGSLILSGSSYTESTWDYMRIYEGIGTSGTQLWNDYVSSSSLLTFGPFIGTAFTVTFHSDASVTYDGFELNVSCDNSDCPRPTNVTLDSVGLDFAQLSWQQSGDNASAWVVEYDTVNFIPGSYAASGTEYAYDTTVTLYGLDSAHTYYVYIHADCGGDTSENVFFTFNTTSSPATVPYVCTFDNAAGWDFVQTGQTNYWTVGSATGNPAGSLYVTNDGSSNSYSTSSTSFSYAVREFYLSETGEYTYSFNWKCNGESNYDYIRAWMAPASATFTAGQTPNGGTSSYDYTSSNPTGWLPLDGGSKLNGQSSWQTRSGAFAINQTGLYKMVFMWANDGSGGSTPPGAIDNIVVNHSTCPPIENLRATAVSNDNATIVWNDTASNMHYEYMVYIATTNSVAAAFDSVQVMSGTTSHTFTGLTGTTHYYVWVVARCNDSDSRLISTDFTTTVDCGTVTGLTATPDYFSFTLNWNAPTVGVPATRYIVSYKAATASSWITDTTVNTYYYVSGLDTNTSYQYRVTTECDIFLSSVASGTVQTNSCGKIVTGGGATNSYLPTYQYYNYSYTQQIYLNEELTGVDTIASIAFHTTATSSGRNVVIYMGNTTQSSFSSTSNYIPLSGLQQVASGSLSGTGWITFNLSTPFVRTAGSNLVVAVDDNTGSYVSSISWTATSTSTTRAIYFYQDGSDINPSSPSASSDNAVNYVNQIKLTNTSCNIPTCSTPIIAVADVQTNAATIVWNTDSNRTYLVEYRLASDTAWTVADSANTTGTYTFSLAPAQVYVVRVSLDCDGTILEGTANITTHCAPVALPYTEDFENYSGTYNRTCWTIGSTNLGSTYPYPTVVNLTGDPNKLCLFWNGAYAIMPRMDAPLNQLQIRFYFVQGGDDVRFLMGLMDDPSDPISTIQVLDTIIRSEIDTSTAYINYTYRFDQLADADTAKYIAFWDAFNDNYSFIDNLVVEYIPNCSPVTALSASNVTTSSVDLSWTSDATTATYIVEYGPHGFTPGTGNTANASMAPYTLMGLNSSTYYDAYIYTVCGADTSIASQVVSFTTACDAIATLPYTMNFEGYVGAGSTATNILPPCWSTEATGAYIYYNTNTSQAPSQSYALQLMGDGIVVLPEMYASLNTLMISFHNYNAGTYGIVVGAVSDTVTANYATAFVPIDTIIDGTEAQASMAVAFLSSYTGSDHRIALKAFGNGGTDVSHYIDNLTVDLIPTCPYVTHLASTGSTNSTVTIDWTENGSALDWEIHVDTLANATPVADSMVSVHPLTVTGLTGGVEYYFWVRPVCSPGDTGAWVGPISAIPGIWIMRANMTDTVHMCGGVIYDDGGPNGSYSASQNSTIIIMPDAPGSLVQVSGSSYTESSWDYITIYDGIGTSGTQLWTDDGISSLTNFGPFISSSGAITVTMESDGSVQYDGFQINVSCIQTYCRVTGLSLDPTVPASGSQLALTWDNNSATSYEVEYGTPGFTPGAGITLTTYTNSIVIPGLTGLTTYEVHVRSICNATDTGDWTSGTFRTEMCDNVTIAESWDSTMTAGTSSYAPMGTSFYNYGYVQTLVDSAQFVDMLGDVTAFAFKPSTANKGDYYNHITVYMANVPESSLSSLITPDSAHVFVKVIDDRDMRYTDDNWQLHSFDSAFTWDGHSNVLVAVKRDHGSYSSGASFETHTTSATRTRYYYTDSGPISITSPSGSSGTGSYVGDLKFYSCDAGGCARPTITSTTGDYQSATMTWAGTGTAYEVAIKAVSDPTWGVEIPVTTNTYTFTGLQPSTPYQLRVRRDCTADGLDYSAWATTTFVTDSLPCLAPESLAVSNQTNATATFGWTAVGTETAWDIHVWNTTYDSIYTVATNPATVGGFTAGVTYNAAVRALCGTAQNIEGEWGDTITFSTATCPQVTGLATSDVTFNSVTLTWTAVTGAQSYRVSYESGQLRDSVVVTTNSYTYMGLQSDRQYTFYVRTVCGDGWYSETYAQVTARTAEEPEDAVTLTVAVNDPSMGYVTINGSQTTTYTGVAGDVVTLAAQAYEGYAFVSWSDGNAEATRSYTLPEADATLTATFRAEEGIDDVAGARCTLYPNPAKGTTTVTVTGISGKVRIAVLDLSGREVLGETVECAADCEKSLDIEGLAEGAYFVRITSEANAPMVRKLIVR